MERGDFAGAVVLGAREAFGAGTLTALVFEARFPVLVVRSPVGGALLLGPLVTGTVRAASSVLPKIVGPPTMAPDDDQPEQAATAVSTLGHGSGTP